MTSPTETFTIDEFRDLISQYANRLTTIINDKYADEFPVQDVLVSAFGALYTIAIKQSGVPKEEFLSLCDHLYENLTVKNLEES